MIRKPGWVFRKPYDFAGGHEMRRRLRSLNLATVCESARCPNRGECFSDGTATFLILGDVCTRHCGFCAVAKGTPEACDPLEPQAIADAVRTLGLRYAVITSVTRDDLPDGGASVFAAVIRALPGIPVEVLIPDFAGSPEALETVLEAGPAVLNHNIETVPRIYPRVRPEAIYARSLDLLLQARRFAPGIVTKSGLMVGLGEDFDEIVAVMRDLAAVGCSTLTIGQYLQPTKANLPVARYVPPEEFAELEAAGSATGIPRIIAGPLVRSSYRAHATYDVPVCD